MTQSNPNYINPQDFEKICGTVPQLHIRKWNDADVVMLFRIMYHMALRPIEAIKLEKSDFDVDNRFVYLGKTKTKQHDKAVIPKVFLLQLEEWLYTKDDGRLFPGLTYMTFWTWITKLGHILDIPAWRDGNSEKMGEKTKGHIFRKSWGKDALEQLGFEKVDVISAHLRHKKPSMTFDHYLKGNIRKVQDTI